MFDENNLVMISALQHLAFCKRQCALIHVEQQWAENRHTVLGDQMHERVHSASSQTQGDLRIARTLRLVSYRLGIVGQADVVEFHRIDDESEPGIHLPKTAGAWRAFPVEYKKGKPKKNREDETQLCAQALCLEEQFGTRISEGALFYGEKRRRQRVVFDKNLREHTETLIDELHRLIDSGETPAAEYGAKCKNCSLIEICSSQWISSMKRRGYERMLFDTRFDREGQTEKETP